MIPDSPSMRRRSGEQEDSFAHDATSAQIHSTKGTRWILNGLIGFLFLVVAYLSYAFIEQQVGESANVRVKPFTPAGKPIQIDVLNGCGVSGVASKVTTYSRRQGFDIVEMRNYKSFDVHETVVIDRVGNLALARQVAQTLGVNKDNIIQEINPDYFVDVSVVIGKDYAALHAMK